MQAQPTSTHGSDIANTPIRAHTTAHHYRPDIDGLRALAVLGVVFYHAFATYLPGGFTGVDVFFVISGYLITGILLRELSNQNFSLIQFYVRRALRIFPALIAVLLFCLIYGWLKLMPADYVTLGQHTTAGSFFYSNWLYWLQFDYFNPAGERVILMHLWSLAVEEQFYLIWPILLYGLYRLKISVFWGLALVIGASFIVNILWIESHRSLVFFGSVFRFWELGLGAALAWWTHRTGANATNPTTPQNTASWLAHTSSFTGILLIVAGFVLIKSSWNFPGWWALTSVMGAVLLMAAGPAAWVNRWILSNRILVGIGLISYPLYLWHWPLLSFLRITSFAADEWWMRLGMVLLAFILSIATYYGLEKPLRFGKPFRLSKNKWASILWLVLIGIGGFGYWVQKAGGFGARMPVPLQQLAYYQYDYHINTNYECMIGAAGEQLDPYPPQCLNPPNPTQQPAVLLWGDSYAWSLYYGLQQLGQQNLNPSLVAAQNQTNDSTNGSAQNPVPSDSNHSHPIIQNPQPPFVVHQQVARSCPPLLDVRVDGVTHCAAHNAQVIDHVRQQPYPTVVLAAHWVEAKRLGLDVQAGLARTVAALRQAGVSRIVLVGPPPHWPQGLWPTMITHGLRDVIEHDLPARLQEGVVLDAALDAQLSQMATQLDVSYVSLQQTLCNPEGCLTKVGDAPDQLTAYDYGHLSRSGSAYVARAFPPLLVAPTQPAKPALAP